MWSRRVARRGFTQMTAARVRRHAHGNGIAPWASWRERTNFHREVVMDIGIEYCTL
jgi:hypothetical protein